MICIEQCLIPKSRFVSCLEKAVKTGKGNWWNVFNSHTYMNAVVKKNRGNNIALKFPIKYVMENLMRIISSFIKSATLKIMTKAKWNLTVTKLHWRFWIIKKKGKTESKYLKLQHGMTNGRFISYFKGSYHFVKLWKFKTKLLNIMVTARWSIPFKTRYILNRIWDTNFVPTVENLPAYQNSCSFLMTLVN